MTQKQIQIKKLHDRINSGILKSISTQTGDNNELIIYLGKNKHVRVYFSLAYKETVISFNFCSKSFILTKSMWLVFKKNLNEIDFLLKNNND